MGDFLQSLGSQTWDYLCRCFWVSTELVILLLAPSLLLALFMQLVSSVSRSQASAAFGSWFYVRFTALGVAVHELSHALFCLIFGHKITEMKLFSPSEDGTLGYVNHSYNPKNLYHRIGNFFIGTAPIWVGSLVLTLLAYLLLGDHWRMLAPQTEIQVWNFTSLDGALRLAQELIAGFSSVGENLLQAHWWSDWQFYVFLFLAFCIGSHVTLSPQDIKGGALDFVLLLLLIYVVNLATVWAGDFVLSWARELARHATLFYSILVGAIALNLIFALLMGLLAAIRRAAS